VVRTAADLADDVRQLVVDGRDAWNERDYERARRNFDEALRIAQRSGDPFAEAAAYHFLANIAFNERRDEESRRLHTLVLDISRVEGDQQGVATSLGGIALVDFVEGDLDAARQNWYAAVAAYEAAEMSDAARALRERASALLEGRVALETLVHRVAPAADTASSRKSG
jgi:tetratricopeptide (TPR) repeat protein